MHQVIHLCIVLRKRYCVEDKIPCLMIDGTDGNSLLNATCHGSVSDLDATTPAYLVC